MVDMSIRTRSRKLLLPLLATLFLAPAVAPAASAEPAAEAVTQQQCATTEWRVYENFITQVDSPWFNSVRGIDFSRSVQFRVLSGVYATRTTATCLEQYAGFAGASQYREKQCKGALACKLTSWRQVNGPSAGYRFPGKYTGYDPHADLFRQWQMPDSPPRPR